MNFYEIKYIVIHCSATPPSQNIGRDEIDRMHKNKGWNKIGYHFVIKRDGTLEKGRAMTEVGAHAYGYNQVPKYQRPLSWGICLIGGVDEEGKSVDNFEPEQYETLKNFLPGLIIQAPNAELFGHRDLSPDINGDGVIEPFEFLKDCPCFSVANFAARNGLTRSQMRLHLANK